MIDTDLMKQVRNQSSSHVDRFAGDRRFVATSRGPLPEDDDGIVAGLGSRGKKNCAAVANGVPACIQV